MSALSGATEGAEDADDFAYVARAVEDWNGEKCATEGGVQWGESHRGAAGRGDESVEGRFVWGP